MTPGARRTLIGCGTLFFTVFAAWVLFAALEIRQNLYWRHIERDNPFVRAYKEGLPWPRADAVSPADAPLTEDPGWTQPPRDPAAEMALRAAFFNTLSPGERFDFAVNYQRLAVVFDGAGRVTEHYSTKPRPWLEGASLDTLAELLDAGNAATLRAAFQTAPGFVSLTLHLDKGGITGETYLYPLPGAPETQMLALFPDPAPIMDEVPADSLWELPFFVYKKHVRKTDSRFSLNNAGFRDGDVAFPKPAGQVRVVCVGGSTTEEGDANALSYPNLLEKRLRERFGPRIEAINCGISGITAKRERLRTPDYLALEPDLLVYYNGANDICHLHLRGWVENAGPFAKMLRASACINYTFNAWFFPDGAGMRAALDETIAPLRRLAQSAKERGVPIAFSSFARPDIAHLPPEERAFYDWINATWWGGKYATFATYCRMVDQYNACLRALCDETGATYIPVAENLGGGANYFGDVCHMKNPGIERKAAIIFEAIAPAMEK